MGVVANNDIVLKDKEFQRISTLVYKYCGITLNEGKKELVRARLAKRLRHLHLPSFDSYIDFATKDTNGAEFISLIDSISTNLTSFYREKQHFDYLTNICLPALEKRKSESGTKRIRVWSAGCSSGEEPYTIALTLLDYFKDKSGWDIKILATDISTKVLESAKKGVYTADRVAPVPSDLKNRYLVKQKLGPDTYYQVKPQVKNMIFFARLNLMEQWPVKGPLDVIFCRNVMIYFDKPTQEKLVGRYWQLIEDGGLLFTGHSESLTGIEHKFKFVQPTVYKK